VTPAAGAVRDAAQRAGLDLRDVLRVEGRRYWSYWSYWCGDEACCPAAGVPFDATAHPVAAGMAAAGKQVLAGRAAMAARVAPVGGIAAESMRQATRQTEQRAARLPAKARRSSRIGAARQMIAAEGLATVDGMIARCRGGGRPAPDYEIARLTVALRDLRVRDDAWARMDPAHAHAHLRLWTDLTCRAQPGTWPRPQPCLPWRAVVSIRSWRVS
jgi:hypothetical protein